jgi:kynurenine formamidase
MVEKRINIVGVEPPSIADVNNIQELQTIHRILMEGDVLILEGLCNLERVILDYVELLALPLKIGQGDGAPVRALIVE